VCRQCHGMCVRLGLVVGPEVVLDVRDREREMPPAFVREKRHRVHERQRVGAARDGQEHACAGAELATIPQGRGEPPHKGVVVMSGRGRESGAGHAVMIMGDTRQGELRQNAKL
jgi:hypothetical protein